MSTIIPSPRILLGPGPSSVSPRVLAALARAPIGYLDPELFDLLDRLRANLRTLFGTANAFTIPLTGTGMAGMESCLANLLSPGDRAVIGVNGFFGGRMVEIARRLGAEVVQVDVEWGRPLEPDDFAPALAAGRTKLVGCVHAETSTGVETPLKPIADIARAHDALFLADAVTSLGGLPVDIDGTGVDACYSGVQKCVGAPPGIAPITVSERALAAAEQRRGAVPNWYYDWCLLRAYYDSPHAYHHTVPVNMLYAVDEALQEILEEGLSARFERHRRVSRLLLEGLQSLGIRPFAPQDCRLPTLSTVSIPDSVTDEAAIRKRLLAEYGIEIGGGLGGLKGKIWRIGTMGSSATERNVLLLVAALWKVLPR
ncbi:MAG TPA: alanine--glyoxylate aminotransferase family protein [Chthonomonadaceae bacterium]|nr:alanine--glyoxylate aminotransferase family protein [Chthonomonadaceae bacterium]